jgi:hypothetical protein
MRATAPKSCPSSILSSQNMWFKIPSFLQPSTKYLVIFQIYLIGSQILGSTLTWILFVCTMRLFFCFNKLPQLESEFRKKWAYFGTKGPLINCSVWTQTLTVYSVSQSRWVLLVKSSARQCGQHSPAFRTHYREQ